ncbi:hypothetical protein JTB14_000503 [Gonioctena quinquepunctata]|nr:hypothetical protein JTB14_000503 [Gonioctena quinquepunctata]
MPIILVIVPGSQHEIKNLKTIIDLDIHFEHIKEGKEGWGNVTTAKNSRTVGTANCKANPVEDVRTLQVLKKGRKEETRQDKPKLLSALDELIDLIVRRPILAGIIQLKNKQGLAENAENRDWAINPQQTAMPVSIQECPSKFNVMNQKSPMKE